MTCEADVQASIRLGLARDFRIPTWRNNCGVLLDVTGRPVRYGLANDSPAMSKKIKSGDLIGTGLTIGGRLLSIEVKPEGWRYTGRGREAAQAQWAELINREGGLAMFATSYEEVKCRILEAMGR